ncbi:MAG: hypothetical protein JWO59_1640 [Chloroflexi bacterium]|nr:hypothetical protein [Chloroflexota bacterium]
MLKRVVMATGLGLALMGGVAAHTSVPVSAQPVAVHADLQVLSTDAQVSDPDSGAPCGTDASGAETGDCQNSQNTAGPEDSAGTSTEN